MTCCNFRPSNTCPPADPPSSSPPPRHSPRRAGAFSLIELLVVIAVIALLISILLPALGNARRTARATLCRSNLKQFATARDAYALDFKNQIYTFSWTSAFMPTQFPDLLPPGGVFANYAFAVQAAEIIRLRSPSEPNFPGIGLWCPGIEYSHFVILDYLATTFPVPIAACPEDKCLQLWQKDIPGFNAGVFGNMQPAFTGFQFRIMRAKPYSSSYETPPCIYDRTQTLPDRLRQTADHYIYGIDSNTRFGPARYDEVTFPSSKVHMHDTHQRHYGRPLYFAHPDARQPLLFFDGSVVDRKTADANLGWQPFNPSAGPSDIPYTPYQYEPPTSNGAPVEHFAGRYRWTRGGLRGIDFGGAEITPSR